MSWNGEGIGRADVTRVEYLNGLFSYAMVLTRNRAQAEDFVQESYVRAMQAMEKVRADSNMKVWLLTILRNVWLNQVRRRRHGPQMVQMEGRRWCCKQPHRAIQRPS
jgi:RNA polymerase sigma-70 factor (ECF subfamily)